MTTHYPTLSFVTNCYLPVIFDCYALNIGHLETVLDKLLGKRFNLDDAKYTIVDVRNIDGETMVYVDMEDSKGPARAAFRYVDIEPRLDDPASESDVA